MISDEQLRHLSTKDFVLVARTHAKNWFEHALIDRLEQVFNDLVLEARPMASLLRRQAELLMDASDMTHNMSLTTTKMAEKMEQMSGAKKD